MFSLWCAGGGQYRNGHLSMGKSPVHLVLYMAAHPMPSITAAYIFFHCKFFCKCDMLLTSYR